MNASRVGIIGAGQLGRMLALAAYPLGVRCRFVDTYEDAPGGQVAPIRVAPLDDAEAIHALAGEVDVMTFDIENVSVEILQSVESTVPVLPGPALVAKTQDRLLEKRLFADLGIPTAPFVAVDTSGDLDRAEQELGWPVVLKSRRLGYDGRGQRIADSRGALHDAWTALGRSPAIAEGWVEFSREVSLIGVRGKDDETRFYPLSENRHRDGQLETSVAPFVDERLEEQAREWMASMLREHDYRGVLTIEFFVANGNLLANEIAPRVHNSGHWTIEGADTSQFENHIRAILGLPLGSTQARGVSVMRNLLGRIPETRRLLGIEGLHLHDYGKAPRPGRKVGHCTIVDASRDTALARLGQLESVLSDSGGAG